MSEQKGAVMSNGSFGWCFLGSGSITRRVYNDFPNTKNSKVVSVYSPTSEHAQAFASVAGAKAYPTALEAINAPGVDGVYVASVNTEHFPLAMAAIAAGKPVLCEKPLTMTYADAFTLIQAAKKAKVYFMEAMWTLHNPVIQTALEWVQQGKIGTLHQVQANFSFYTPFNEKSRLFAPSLGGGAMLDLGVYDLAIASRFFSVWPDSLISTAELSKDGIDMASTCILQYPGGAQAILQCGTTTVMPEYAWISGTKGYIQIEHLFAPKKMTLRAGKLNVVYEDSFPGEGYQYQFDAAVADIQNGKLENDIVTHDFSLKVMKLIDLSLASFQKGSVKVTQ
jgi:predicted dehydrogenase